MLENNSNFKRTHFTYVATLARINLIRQNCLSPSNRHCFERAIDYMTVPGKYFAKPQILKGVKKFTMV